MRNALQAPWARASGGAPDSLAKFPRCGDCRTYEDCAASTMPRGQPRRVAHIQHAGRGLSRPRLEESPDLGQPRGRVGSPGVDSGVSRERRIEPDLLEIAPGIRRAREQIQKQHVVTGQPSRGGLGAAVVAPRQRDQQDREKGRAGARAPRAGPGEAHAEGREKDRLDALLRLGTDEEGGREEVRRHPRSGEPAAADGQSRDRRRQEQKQERRGLTVEGLEGSEVARIGEEDDEKDRGRGLRARGEDAGRRGRACRAPQAGARRAPRRESGRRNGEPATKASPPRPRSPRETTPTFETPKGRRPRAAYAKRGCIQR